MGWFLHTPFPSSEIYRTLPVREEVLRAVLKADLIGFHTYDYARHFISSCTRILGLEVCSLLCDAATLPCCNQLGPNFDGRLHPPPSMPAMPTPCTRMYVVLCTARMQSSH